MLKSREMSYDIRFFCSTLFHGVSILIAKIKHYKTDRYFCVQQHSYFLVPDTQSSAPNAATLWLQQDEA